jgi:hypothetical protein
MIHQTIDENLIELTTELKRISNLLFKHDPTLTKKLRLNANIEIKLSETWGKEDGNMWEGTYYPGLSTTDNQICITYRRVYADSIEDLVNKMISAAKDDELKLINETKLM